MHNYKALKSASKVSVQKVKVVDRAKVDEVKYKDKPMSEWPEEFQINKIKEYPDSKDRVMEGMVAQEVKAVCDELGVAFSGWTESDLSTRQRLQYERFVMPLIKSVQELSAKVKALEDAQ